MPARPPKRDWPRAPHPRGADAPRRPPLRWRLWRSWPEGMPFDRAMSERLVLDLEQRNLKRALQERFERSGSRLGRIRVWHAIAFFACWAVPWWMTKGLEHVTGADLGTIAFLPTFVLGWVLFSRWTTVGIWHPRLRAAMRREGVDCCVRCGQLMRRGLEADRCPECGFDHAAFPLGWEPDRIASSTPSGRRDPGG